MQLAYISMAARPLTADDLEQIVERSRIHNRARRITGLLLLQGPFFYGIMEGRRRAVLGRMEVIIADDRHRRLRILREEAARSHRFGNWSFGELPESRRPTPDVSLPASFIHELSRRLG